MYDAVHGPAHSAALNLLIIEFRLIAEILKCLGICLAHYFCLRILVKYIDDLPCISVWDHTVLCDRIIIIRQTADLILVS